MCNGHNTDIASKQGIDDFDQKVNGLGGVIAIDADGRIGFAFNTHRMARAYMQINMEQPIVEIN